MLQAGIRPVFSVDKNPEDQDYSKFLSVIHHANFGEYGSKFLDATVQQVAETHYQDFPQDLFVLHASPPCVNYSNLKNLDTRPGILNGEKLSDVEIARSVAYAVEKLRPQYFTLECVPRYQSGSAYAWIDRVLKALEYTVNFAVCDLADYAVPQNRARFFVFASRADVPPLKMPAKVPQVGWRRSVQGCSTSPCALTDTQKEAYTAFLETNEITDVLIQKTTYGRKLPVIRQAIEPCWTIAKSLFIDGKKGSRSKAITGVIDGKSCALGIRAIAQLCGFYDWYALPDNFGLAGSILGNSLPSTFYAYFWKSNKARLKITQ